MTPKCFHDPKHETFNQLNICLHNHTFCNGTVQSTSAIRHFYPLDESFFLLFFLHIKRAFCVFGNAPRNEQDNVQGGVYIKGILEKLIEGQKAKLDEEFWAVWDVTALRNVISVTKTLIVYTNFMRELFQP